MLLGARDPLRIRLTGRGGQGVMLAGAVLAEAAMRAGLQVAQTQEYGPEARLGATKSEVVISAEEIAFPVVQVPDVLLCLSRPGYLRYGREVAPGGWLVAEETLGVGGRGEEGEVHVLALPLLAVAREMGTELVANMVGLGALVGLVGVVGEEPLLQALRARVKPEFRELNERAVARGRELVETLHRLGVSR